MNLMSGGGVDGVSTTIQRIRSHSTSSAVDRAATATATAAPFSVGQTKYTLTYAIKKGYFNLVRTLLALGADPNQVDASEERTNGPTAPLKRNPLIYTTYIRDLTWAKNIARLLLEHGADLSHTDSRRLTPIHYCCAFGRTELLELFLDSLDFDLSRARDQNGNSCMHYAMRTHNLKCVRMLLAKYRSSHMAVRVDLENVFGLRPSQIEEVIGSEEGVAAAVPTRHRKPAVDLSVIVDGDVTTPDGSAYSTSTLIECREELLIFIRISSQMKAKLNKPVISVSCEATDTETKSDSRKRNNKTGKKSKTGIIGKSKSRAAAATAAKVATKENERRVSFSDLAKTIDNQGDELSIRIQPEPFIPESAAPTPTPTSNSSSRLVGSAGKKSPSSSPSSTTIWGSNFNHIISKRSSSSSENLLNQTKRSNQNTPTQEAQLPITTTTVSTPNSLLQKRTQSAHSSPPRPPIDLHQARILSHKSFLIELKDLLQNFIEYNSLFSGKESMAVGIFEPASRPKSSFSSTVRQVIKRPQTTTTSYMIGRNSFKSSSRPTSTIVDWKSSLPSVYYALECYMSPSYRETIRPPVSTKLKYSNKDFLDFKAKLKRNSLRMQPRRSSSSIITHSNAEQVNQAMSENASESSESGDTVVSMSSRRDLRRNSVLVVGGPTKRNSVDVSNSSQKS